MLRRSVLSPQYLATYRQHPLYARMGLRYYSSATSHMGDLGHDRVCDLSQIRSAHRRYFIKSESVMEIILQTLPRSYSPGSFGLACLLPVGPYLWSLSIAVLSRCSPLLDYTLLALCHDPLIGHRSCAGEGRMIVGSKGRRSAYFFSLGLFTPYLLRRCLRSVTPPVSRVPRTMW